MDLQYVFVVVATVLAGLPLHTCQTEDITGMYRNPNSKKIYCGRHLSQTLSAVCKGKYNTLNKKQETFNASHRQRDQYIQDDQYSLDYPYRSKVNARSLITNFRRRKRGVFNECCEKPCSHEELSTYCANRK